MNTRIVTTFIAYAFAGVIAFTPAWAQRTYSIAPVQGLQSSGRRALNNHGEITGQIYTQTGDYNAYSWSGGALNALGQLPGDDFSGAYSINEHDQIVGESYGYTSMTDQPVLWNHGVIQPLGLLPGYAYGAADAINYFGQAAGACTNDFYFSTTEATLWKNGKIFDLAPLPGDASSFATALNNFGLVVGYSSSDQTRAVVWKDRKPTELPGLGGGYTGAESVNDWGHVVGESVGTDGNQYAVFWKDGKLGTFVGLPGATLSGTGSINEEDLVVGYSGPDGADLHAVLWYQGHIYDLNALIPAGSGWVLQDAVTINDRSQIFGFGLLNGAPSAFLLTPR